MSAYIYADAGEGESTTDLVFAGHNIIAENGAIIAQSDKFTNGITYGEIDLDKIAAERARMTTFVSGQDIDSEYEEIEIYLEEEKFDFSRVIDNARLFHQTKVKGTSVVRKFFPFRQWA